MWSEYSFSSYWFGENLKIKKKKKKTNVKNKHEFYCNFINTINFLKTQYEKRECGMPAKYNDKLF